MHPSTRRAIFILLPANRPFPTMAIPEARRFSKEHAPPTDVAANYLGNVT
jgi:hypothetical protein